MNVIQELAYGYTSITQDLIDNLLYEIRLRIERKFSISLSTFMPDNIRLKNSKLFLLHYSISENDVDAKIEGYIQDFYGESFIPSIAGKKTKISLLAPNKRPIQITSDLNGFWKNTYPDLSKSLKRDYPKHYWPENPEIAKPILLKRNAEK